MPMGGGTFTVQNKTLPGAYINFVSASGAVSSGERGTVALPLELSWGPENKVYAVAAASFYQMAQKELGYDPTAPELLPVREAMKRCGKLLIYRVNSGGVKAAATLGGLTATAKYGGTRGNAMKVSIEVNPDDESQVDVVTYLEEAETDRQTVKATGGTLTANDYVSFAATGTLTAAEPTER